MAWALGDEIRFGSVERERRELCAQIRTKGAPQPLIGFTSTLDSGSWMADEFRRYRATRSPRHHLRRTKSTFKMDTSRGCKGPLKS